MPRRSILTERQRAALFDLPTDEASMLRHFTLADDDLEYIRERRRPHNRFGFALQLCALRYPGRLLAPGEIIPEPITIFLAAQLGLRSDDLAQRFVERCRATQTILPGVTVIERLCADALVAAERRIEARVVGHLEIGVRNKLDALLTEDVDGSVSRFVWLRQFEVGQNSADMNRLLDRLEFLQGLKLDTAILGAL